MTVAPSEFDAFCRFAFAFLEERGIRTLVVGGLAVIVVGEPRRLTRMPSSLSPPPRPNP